MFKWLFRQCLDAMGKKRTAEVKMVGPSDAQEAIQALDVGYTATVELIYAQAEIKTRKLVLVKVHQDLRRRLRRSQRSLPLS